MTDYIEGRWIPSPTCDIVCNQQPCHHSPGIHGLVEHLDEVVSSLGLLTDDDRDLLSGWLLVVGTRSEWRESFFRADIEGEDLPWDQVFVDLERRHDYPFAG
jgi:hypothetical protein